MALARYESVAVNTAGDVIPNATVEVRRDQPGRPVVPLFADREGTVPIGNPITTDAEGKFGFHVPGDSYYIRVFTGPSQQPFQQYVRRYQAIGTAAERDVEDIASALEAGTATFPTIELLQAFVPSADEGIGGKVTTGPDAGFYHYNPLAEEGERWIFDRPLFDTLARMNVTGGDANDIEAEIVSGVADSAVVMLWIEAAATNTAPVRINEKPVLTIEEEELLPGQWLAGRTYWFSDEGTFYKLRTESDVSGLVAQAEAAATAAQDAQLASETAQTGAEIARDEAQGYAAGLNIAPIAPGDAGKLLQVNNEEDGSDWIDLPPPPDTSVGGEKLTKRLSARVGALFETVADMLADATLSYTDIDPGDIVEAQGSRYEVADSAATDEHVETAGGVLLYLRKNADLTVYSDQAGIDASTTSAAAINKMLTDALAAGARTVKMAKGDWTPDGQLIWPVGLKELDWQGGLITQNSSVGVGEFALKYEDSLEVLPALASDIDRTTEVIEFASAHGLAVGDVIGFRNTTTSSLNAWRTTYYDGQQTVVRNVVSSTQITVFDMIDPRGALAMFPSASTEVIRYPNTSRGLALRNLTMRGGTSIFGMVRLRGMSRFELENLDISGGSYAAAALGLAAYGRSEGLFLNNDGSPTGQQYGLVHEAVSFHKTFGTVAYATRHALHHGNSDGVGALPPRGNEHHGVTLGSDTYAALDFGHGNILDHRVVGGTVQGLVLGGENNHVDIDTLTTAEKYDGGNRSLVGANLHGMNHKVRIGKIVAAGDGTISGSPSSHGIIGFGGTGDVFTASTVHGGILDIEVGTLDARNWSSASAMLTRFRNRGFAGQWGLRVHIGQVICPVEPQWFNMGNVSGSAPILLDIGPAPDRWDPSGSPTHGWNAADRGIAAVTMATGAQVNLPVLSGSVANAGGSIASGVSVAIAVSGFSGLTQRDSVSFGASGALGGNFNVSAFVTSSTAVVIMVSNVTAGSLTLNALTWYAYVTKRP